MSITSFLRCVCLAYSAVCVGADLWAFHEPDCTIESQPNPISKQYPNDVTGTLNVTLLIVPTPLEQIRSIVPNKWGILEQTYRSLLLNFPKNQYPLLVQAGIDHDIRLEALNISVPDFSRFNVQFPFINLLGDGHSSFVWNPSQLLTAGNQIAIDGARQYGQQVWPASFLPTCNAYGHGRNGTAYFQGAAISNISDHERIWAIMEASPLEKNAKPKYPLSVFQNMTNQPIFGNGTLCDKQVRLFNTSLSTGIHAPKAVTARVTGNVTPFGKLDPRGKWEAAGWQVDAPFIEYNGISCRKLKGYA